MHREKPGGHGGTGGLALLTLRSRQGGKAAGAGGGPGQTLPGSHGRNQHLGLGPPAPRAVGRTVGSLLGQPPHRPIDQGARSQLQLSPSCPLRGGSAAGLGQSPRGLCLVWSPPMLLLSSHMGRRRGLSEGPCPLPRGSSQGRAKAPDPVPQLGPAWGCWRPPCRAAGCPPPTCQGLSRSPLDSGLVPE